MGRVSLPLFAALLTHAVLPTAWGQAPLYSATSIVNASNFVAGPFAPGSIVSIFGTNLAFSTQSLASENITVSTLPTELANISVYVDNQPAPLLFASPGQINFLIPSTEIAGGSSIRVVRQSITGPTVTVTLVDSAPALFSNSDGTAIATDYNAANAVVTESAPAKPNDLIVLYVTGLGRTQPNAAPGEIPTSAAPIVNMSSLQVLLNGKAVPASYINYAGVTPGFAGLYQINFFLPGDCGTDPQIQVSVAGQTSSAGVKLAVRPVTQSP
jgi:uncharacterized protein (TIGR03437 family)